jgi:predicted RNase H-like nuclease (RuvC/YqgF family)
MQPPKFEPTPKSEPNFALEQKLQEYTRQRDELNRNIEQLHAELAGRAEVGRLQKQLEQVQMQLSEEQKHRKELEAAYQVCCPVASCCFVSDTCFFIPSEVVMVLPMFWF